MTLRDNLAPTPATSGFSLIEIALAIGVIAFALVAILGLFPVALDSATDSKRETQAALIARSIYTDIIARQEPTRFLITSKDFGEKTTTETVNLTANEDHYLAYDADGLLNGSINSGTYASGATDAGYLAHIKIRQLDATSTNPAGLQGLSQIDVTVGAPGAAREEARSHYPFVTYIRQGHPTPTPAP